MISNLFERLSHLIYKKLGLSLKNNGTVKVSNVIESMRVGDVRRVKYNGKLYFGIIPYTVNFRISLFRQDKNVVLRVEPLKKGDNFKAPQKIDYKYLSVIGIFLRKYFSSTFFLLGILLVSILLTFSFNLYPTTYLFLFTLMLLLLKHWSFTYCLKHGFYGTSDAEAREIIQFIIDNADDIDFTDDGESKKILKAEDMEYFEEKVSTLNPVTAREVQA